MRFVVRIHQHGWSFAELAATWRECERLGYDGASLYDVLGIDGPECWTALTALTARTATLAAVPLVLSLPYRHPAVLARMAATFGAAAPGRLILGLGAGGGDADASAHGIGWPGAGARIGALGEAVTLLRQLWGEGGSHHGRYYQLHEAPGWSEGAAGPGPPVLIGGHGPRLLRTAARHGDLCNIGFDLSPGQWEELASQLAARAREAGRLPASLQLTHNATVLLGADEEQFARQLPGWAARRGLPVQAARRRLEHALAGTPGQVRDRLRELQAAGVSWVFLLFEDARDFAALRLFAEAVIGQL